MLGLLHLCFLHDHNADNAARLYRLSRSGRQEFPLAVVSLNITKWTMQVRAEQLAPFAPEGCMPSDLHAGCMHVCL